MPTRAQAAIAHASVATTEADRNRWPCSSVQAHRKRCTSSDEGSPAAPRTACSAIQTCVCSGRKALRAATERGGGGSKHAPLVACTAGPRKHHAAKALSATMHTARAANSHTSAGACTGNKRATARRRSVCSTSSHKPCQHGRIHGQAEKPVMWCTITRIEQPDGHAEGRHAHSHSSHRPRQPDHITYLCMAASGPPSGVTRAAQAATSHASTGARAGKWRGQPCSAHTHAWREQLASSQPTPARRRTRPQHVSGAHAAQPR